MTTDKLLLDILNIQSVSKNSTAMDEFITKHCIDNDYIIEYDDYGNLYVTKGEAEHYPCVVAHTDTVHEIIPDDHYKVFEVDGWLGAFDTSQGCMTGIGGDDKVGIYIALKTLTMLDYAKAAFFLDEEMGCVGSSQATVDFFDDCRFILQCDRQGNQDFVTNILGVKLSSNEFFNDIKHIVKQHGYKNCLNGGLTDVYELKTSGVNLSVANIACGYWHPHTNEETINIADVNNVLAMVVTICDELQKPYPHEYKEPNYYGYSRRGSLFKDSYSPFNDDVLDDYDDVEVWCSYCDDFHPEDKGYEVGDDFICESCYKDLEEYGLMPELDKQTKHIEFDYFK